MPDGLHGAFRHREAVAGVDRRGSCVPGDLGRLRVRYLLGLFAARLGDAVGERIVFSFQFSVLSSQSSTFSSQAKKGAKGRMRRPTGLNANSRSKGKRQKS